MAQTTFGQTDALALALAAWVNANSGGFCLAVKAQRRFRLVDTLTALPDVGSPVQVDVFPDLEIGERQGISGPFSSQYAVHLYIQQRLTLAFNGDEDAQCGYLAQLRSEIIEGLKMSVLSLANAVHPPQQGVYLAHVKNAEQKGLYDLARLLEQHVFASDTILVFRAAV